MYFLLDSTNFLQVTDEIIGEYLTLSIVITTEI